MIFDRCPWYIAGPLLGLTAGVAMGFGARTAGGCTSGHGMSGRSLGSPASIASSMTFFAVAALARRRATRIASAVTEVPGLVGL